MLEEVRSISPLECYLHQVDSLYRNQRKVSASWRESSGSIYFSSISITYFCDVSTTSEHPIPQAEGRLQLCCNTQLLNLKLLFAVRCMDVPTSRTAASAAFYMHVIVLLLLCSKREQSLFAFSSSAFALQKPNEPNLRSQSISIRSRRIQINNMLVFSSNLLLSHVEKPVSFPLHPPQVILGNRFKKLSTWIAIKTKTAECVRHTHSPREGLNALWVHLVTFHPQLSAIRRCWRHWAFIQLSKLIAGTLPNSSSHSLYQLHIRGFSPKLHPRWHRRDSSATLTSFCPSNSPNPKASTSVLFLPSALPDQTRVPTPKLLTSVSCKQ